MSLHLKKEVRNGGYFWLAVKRQSFYKLVLSFLVEVARHIQNTQNRKLIIFLQCIKKKLSQLHCVLLWCKTFRYFTGVQSYSLLLVNSFFAKQYSFIKNDSKLPLPIHFQTDKLFINLKICKYWHIKDNPES